jgi:hypothetical protein
MKAVLRVILVLLVIWTGVIAWASANEKPYDFIKVSPADIANCDESDGGPKPELVPLKDSEGLMNLSLLKTAKANASSLIPGYPRRHRIQNLNDGLYNNGASWIPAEMPAWAEIDLGNEYIVQKVVFGSEHSAFWTDRAATKFRILVAKHYSPDSKAPCWKEVYSYDNNNSAISNTTEFRFPPQRCRYVRVEIEKSVAGDVRIDELEIYGKRPFLF